MKGSAVGTALPPLLGAINALLIVFGEVVGLNPLALGALIPAPLTGGSLLLGIARVIHRHSSVLRPAHQPRFRARSAWERLTTFSPILASEGLGLADRGHVQRALADVIRLSAGGDVELTNGGVSGLLVLDPLGRLAVELEGLRVHLMFSFDISRAGMPRIWYDTMAIDAGQAVSSAQKEPHAE